MEHWKFLMQLSVGIKTFTPVAIRCLRRSLIVISRKISRLRGFVRSCDKTSSAILNPPQGLYSLSGRTSYRKISWSLKSRSREVRVQTFPIALKLDRHIGSNAAQMPVKFQSDTIMITSNLFTKLGGNTQIARFMVPTCGPPGSCRPKVGLM